MTMISSYSEWISESKAWYPTFKAEGEVILEKEAVSFQELEEIAKYFLEIYRMENVSLGKIMKRPDTLPYVFGGRVSAYGVTGTSTGRVGSTRQDTFTYYWEDTGWRGRLDTSGGKIIVSRMSPFEFLECVEMHYFYSHAWIEGVMKAHLKDMQFRMDELGSKTSRRGSIAGKKYGV